MSRLRKIGWTVGLLLMQPGVAAAGPAVVETNVNLRAGPGPSHSVVVVIPAGSGVQVGECNGEWCRVEFRGQRGYVSSAILNGKGAYASAPLPAESERTPDDGARVWQWQDREWRDRYWRDLEHSRSKR